MIKKILLDYNLQCYLHAGRFKGVLVNSKLPAESEMYAYGRFNILANLGYTISYGVRYVVGKPIRIRRLIGNLIITNL